MTHEWTVAARGTVFPPIAAGRSIHCPVIEDALETGGMAGRLPRRESAVSNKGAIGGRGSSTLTSIVPKPERRLSPRKAKVLRVGLLECDQGAQLCLIRDISSGGLRADLHYNLARGTKASIELNTGRRLQGTIIWYRNEQAGMEFDQPVDVEDFLAPEPAVPCGPKPRLPRIGVNRVVTVRSGARLYRAPAVDISQGGMKIATDAIHEGDEVVVLLADFKPIPGSVRWSKAGCSGIAFDQLLPLRCLSHWVKAQRLQEKGPAGGRPLGVGHG
jgi:hypothetical protein